MLLRNLHVTPERVRACLMQMYQVGHFFCEGAHGIIQCVIPIAERTRRLSVLVSPFKGFAHVRKFLSPCIFCVRNKRKFYYAGEAPSRSNTFKSGRRRKCYKTKDIRRKLHFGPNSRLSTITRKFFYTRSLESFLRSKCLKNPSNNFETIGPILHQLDGLFIQLNENAFVRTAARESWSVSLYY